MNLRNHTMEDHSMFQGIRELRGALGNYRFESNGDIWAVYRQSGHAFEFIMNTAKDETESNTELYERVANQ